MNTAGALPTSKTVVPWSGSCLSKTPRPLHVPRRQGSTAEQSTCHASSLANLPLRVSSVMTRSRAGPISQDSSFSEDKKEVCSLGPAKACKTPSMFLKLSCSFCQNEGSESHNNHKQGQNDLYAGLERLEELSSQLDSSREDQLCSAAGVDTCCQNITIMGA